MRLANWTSLSLCCLTQAPGFASRVEAQNVVANLRLGFSGCSPAIFVPLRPEMTVKLSGITYADVQIAGKTHHDQGMLKSFAEEISYAKSKPLLLAVTVNLDKWTGMCSSLEYSLEAAGTTHRSLAYDVFDQDKLPRAVAFAPEADSGILLAGGPLQGDLVTEFATDEQGRRFIRRQTFVIDGTTYQVSYSAYGYKGPPTGKLASFTAHIIALFK